MSNDFFKYNRKKETKWKKNYTSKGRGERSDSEWHEKYSVIKATKW